MMKMDDLGAESMAQSVEDARLRVLRTDLRTRDLVNQAVASVPTLGLQRAAEFRRR
ncbi:hypothetical protein [Massilia sp. Dwa41.01b]|uniref:hypothetical protein n=1 Tax=Massilia sp. Dwa41.01b TaxID=2709302 RepID=UPI001E40377A|nr:hypothetical protein [Massilia sp. Dwa41.01b]